MELLSTGLLKTMLNNKKNYFQLLTIIILGLVLRLIISNQSFWLDEAAQAWESSRPLNQQLKIIGDFQPPLYHLWVHLFTYFGSGEVWLRLASIIPGIITIFYTYQLGRLLFNKKVATISSLLLSTSQFHIFYLFRLHLSME